MPGQDGTGPLGQGTRSGRGRGLCNSNRQTFRGYGRGYGAGFLRNGFCGGGGRGMGVMNQFRRFFGFRRSVVEEQDLQAYINDLEAELRETKEHLSKVSKSTEHKDDK